MKILFLINKAGDGGSERFVLDLAEELNRRGNECVLGYCLEGPLAEKAKAAGIRTVRLGLERKDFFSAPKKIAELCRLEGIDVIHAQVAGGIHLPLVSGPGHEVAQDKQGVFG